MTEMDRELHLMVRSRILIEIAEVERQLANARAAERYHRLKMQEEEIIPTLWGEVCPEMEAGQQ